MTDDEIISHLAQLHPYWKYGTDLYLQRKDLLGPKDRVKVFTIMSSSFTKMRNFNLDAPLNLAKFIDAEFPNSVYADTTALSIITNILRYFYSLKRDLVFSDDQTRKQAALLLGYGEILCAIEYRIGLEKRN